MSVSDFKAMINKRIKDANKDISNVSSKEISKTPNTANEKEIELNENSENYTIYYESNKYIAIDKYVDLNKNDVEKNVSDLKSIDSFDNNKNIFKDLNDEKYDYLFNREEDEEY